MASIIDKAYDASKKIARAIFRGAPNLFTTSDINRQFEAIKAQLDFLEDKIGCAATSNVKISASVSGSTLTVKVEPGGAGVMQFYVRGIKYETTSFANLTKSSIGSSGEWYVVMKATTKIVDYNDGQYDISGAEFSDSIHQPAADHVVYDTFTLSLESTNILPANVMCVLAKIIYKDSKVYVREYYKNGMFTNGLHSDSGLFAMAQNRMEDINTKETTEPGVNVSYDSVLSYMARTIVPKKAILPFYGDISTVLPYGWIPCGYIAYVGYTGASVSSFASNATYKAYVALYGSGNIAFKAESVGNYTYLRIDRCLTINIPNIAGKFLVGGVPTQGVAPSGWDLEWLPKFEETGGEVKHTLSEGEMPQHSHGGYTNGGSTDGSHKHNIPVYVSDTIIDHSSSGHNQVRQGTGTTSTDGAHKHKIEADGGGYPHENRPPYHAVYYIMRVV